METGQTFRPQEAVICMLEGVAEVSFICAGCFRQSG